MTELEDHEFEASGKTVTRASDGAVGEACKVCGNLGDEH